MDVIKEIDKEIRVDKNGLYMVSFTYTTKSGAICYDKMTFYNKKDAEQHIKKIRNMIAGRNSDKRIL